MDEDENMIIDVVSPDEPAGGLKQENGGYAWEEEYKRSWDVLQEDENGLISTTVTQLSNQLKRKRLLRDTRTLHRGLVRHLILVVDLSESMAEKDLKPSRHDLVLSTLSTFLVEFFDQNPLSQVAVVVTHDELAHLVTELSSNPADHVRALRNAVRTPKGEPSLQNALELARGTLAHVPSHGTREVLVVFSSLTTCDPGNILDTLDALVKDSVRVSVISLAAEVHICKKIAQSTHGTFTVALNEPHLKELILENVPPPPIAQRSMARKASNLMRMGFPERITERVPTLCACHSKPTTKGFTCPVCSAKMCSVPAECVLCGLTLVLSPHLARSYHHLFPVLNFIEVTDWCKIHADNECAGCMGALPAPPAPGEQGLAVMRTQATGRYACPRCNQHYCIECDVFIHEALHNCPTCSSGTSAGSPAADAAM
ncbi:hypothetical protein GGF31_008931 [Allomyces arbusculus]|nr:hypothetical protein GGF31_008931 [Allomyces arbusculus]